LNDHNVAEDPYENSTLTMQLMSDILTMERRHSSERRFEPTGDLTIYIFTSDSKFYKVYFQTVSIP